MTTQTVDIVNLAAELAQVQAAKKQLEEREESLKALLRELQPGKHDAGAFTVSITPVRRLDEAKLANTYPSSDWPHFYVAKPNTKVIQNSIAPALYQALMSEVGKPMVKVS